MLETEQLAACDHLVQRPMHQVSLVQHRVIANDKDVFFSVSHGKIPFCSLLICYVRYILNWTTVSPDCILRGI